MALAAILVVTAAWWALALWPVGTVQADWLERTRAACFGAMPGGLPDAGGWILLVGEPAGMLVALLGIWGRSLRRDLQTVRGHRAWQATGLAGIALLLVGASLLVTRAARASANGRVTLRLDHGVPLTMDVAAPDVPLVDQHGRRTSLAGLRGHPTLLTFAFGHCTTVCPAVVHDIVAIRGSSGRTDVPLVVVTLDPWRDTPERLPTMTEGWHLASNDLVLSGAVTDVQRALDQLGIGRRRNETTGDIEHGPTAMLLDARGHIRYRFDGGLGNLGELLRASR
jgi:cytochrome oxidase Cu insertion factor (SCO1/SenC/PrrC family)